LTKPQAASAANLFGLSKSEQTLINEVPMRGIAVGRRNWTFAGSDEGGRRAAAVYAPA
jgi:hypothetical protein